MQRTRPSVNGTRQSACRAAATVASSTESARWRPESATTRPPRNAPADRRDSASAMPSESRDRRIVSRSAVLASYAARHARAESTALVATTATRASESARRLSVRATRSSRFELASATSLRARRFRLYPRRRHLRVHRMARGSLRVDRARHGRRQHVMRVAVVDRVGNPCDTEDDRRGEREPHRERRAPIGAVEARRHSVPSASISIGAP
jgi:hypothetical protein